MIHCKELPKRILAFDPCHRGIGFVVLESGNRLVDCGVYRIANLQRDTVSCPLRSLILRYQPSHIVTECTEAAATRRGSRAKTIVEAVAAVGKESNSPVSRYSIAQVRVVFSRWKVGKKSARAAILVNNFPVLRMYLPPRRRPWMSEDPRMAIFDALSFAITHLALAQEQDDTKQDIPY